MTLRSRARHQVHRSSRIQLQNKTKIIIISQPIKRLNASARAPHAKETTHRAAVKAASDRLLFNTETRTHPAGVMCAEESASRWSVVGGRCAGWGEQLMSCSSNLNSEEKGNRSPGGSARRLAVPNPPPIPSLPPPPAPRGPAPVMRGAVVAEAGKDDAMTQGWRREEMPSYDSAPPTGALNYWRFTQFHLGVKYLPSNKESYDALALL